MAKHKTFIAAAALALLFPVSCSKPTFRDFGFLVDKTASNKKEIGQIIANYRNSASREEREAYEYILGHIDDQYRINFKLEKDDRTVSLDGRIGMDSIISLQNQGFVVNLRDTVRDLDLLAAADIRGHIRRFVKGWNCPQPGIKLSFPTYLRYALAYRTNNEHPEVNFTINGRYSVPDMVRKNAAKDTIGRIRKKVSTIANLYSKNLNGVNFLNTFDQKGLLSKERETLFSDYEDRFIFEIGMLRQTGIPAAGLFYPHRRHGANRPYNVHVVKGEEAVDSLKLENIAKLYASSFEAEDWDNPFDKLLSLGVEKESIPLSLYIPKMQDVTDRVAETGEIQYPISGQTTASTAKPVAYLCTYSLGQWIPIDFSIAHDGKARFSKMGTNVLYLICTYAGGNLIPVSRPITLDGPKRQIEIAGSGATVEATLTQEGNNKTLQKNKTYSLYVWNKEAGWAHLRDFRTGEAPVFRTGLPENMLYLVKTRESSFFAPRPFTLDGNKQVWW